MSNYTLTVLYYLIDTHHYKFIIKGASAKQLSQEWPNFESNRRGLLIVALKKLNFILKNDLSKEGQANMEFLMKLKSGAYFDTVPRLRAHNGCEKVIAVVPVMPVSRLAAITTLLSVTLASWSRSS